MKHLKTFEGFVNEINESILNEAKLTSKPQWRLGDSGDARYSVGLEFAGNKLSLAASCNGIMIGRMYGAQQGEEPAEDWGSSYSINPSNTRFSLDMNADKMKDLLNGLSDYIESIVKDANNDFLKSAIAKQSGWDLSKLKVNKVKEVSVELYAYSDLWKKTDMKNMDDAQKIAFLDEVKKMIESTFKNVSGIELQNTYGKDSFSFVVKF